MEDKQLLLEFIKFCDNQNIALVKYKIEQNMYNQYEVLPHELYAADWEGLISKFLEK